MIQYNATVELDSRDDIDERLLTELDDYHPATGRSPYGRVLVTITLPAETMAQAAKTALLVVGAAARKPLLAIEVMHAEEFDRRLGVGPVPELASVTEAAEQLGVSRQAVLQRLEAGTLPGQKVGNGWVIPRAALQAR